VASARLVRHRFPYVTRIPWSGFLSGGQDKTPVIQLTYSWVACQDLPQCSSVAELPGLWKILFSRFTLLVQRILGNVYSLGMYTPTPKSERLNLRLTTEAKDRLREGADLAQQDMSSFILGAALDKARTLALESRVLELSSADFTQLLEQLENPQHVPERLSALLGDPTATF